MDNIIFETEYWKATLSHDQYYLGRSYVILKRPCPDLSNIYNEEWLDLAGITKQLETALKKAFGATLLNWSCLMNNAYQNTPPDPQVHWHVRPRYYQPVKFGGEEWTDSAFGHHYLTEASGAKERVFSDEMYQSILNAVKISL